LVEPAAPAKLDVVGESRLANIAHELRCLVCQNQSIADSNAGLAVDLRNQIRAQISAGKTDGQIRDFMVARYGDFVLYRPPFKASTALLWIGPFLMLLGGIAVWWRLTRRGATPSAACNTGAPANAADLDRLLGK
jgi:cytochrome c-type biogenesis protein CcmH